MSGNGFHSNLEPALKPRKGNTLKVLGIARISTDKQNERSLDDQRALHDRWLKTHCNERRKLKLIATQASGERLDRAELKQARRLVRRRKVDLILVEDVGRIMRRMHVMLFCELCEDYGVRLISINDHIDTALPSWRSHTFFAAFRHELSNSDTLERIQRSLRNRFLQGGVIRPPIFGLEIPPGAKTDDQIRKADGAQAIYDEWVRQLEDGTSYSEVADWTNDRKVPLPKSATDKGATRWTGSLIKKTIFNPLVKGVRQRNAKKSKRDNKTGRHYAVNAPPEERLERPCPHLAFIEPARWDKLVKMLTKKNAELGHPKESDPRLGRPKKRSRWPGQHMVCGVCGQTFVYGGHGQAHHLMCNGARKYLCWLGASIDGPLAAQKMSAAIFQEIATLPDFDRDAVASLENELRNASGERSDRLRQLSSDEKRNARERGNVAAAIRELGGSETLLADLRRLEIERDAFADVHDELDVDCGRKIVVPTIETVRQMFYDEFQGLAIESWTFARLMRRLIPRIVVHPYRLCDGGAIVFRANLMLDLTKLHRDLRHADGLRQQLQRQLIVDLFDPPQRAAFRERVVEMRTTLNQHEVAKQLGITTTAAQYAAALDRLMQSMGLSDPYIRIKEPPADMTKMRRHLHPRYRFEPLPDGEAV